MRLLALVLIFLSPHAFAACGYVNGAYVCTDKPGCGVVNGVEKCAEQAGCGYVNGAYTCATSNANAPAAPGIKNPAAGGGDKEDAGPVAGLEWLSNFFAGKGADDWMASALTWAIKKAVVMWLGIKLWAMKIAWSVANGVLDSFGVFQKIAEGVAALPASAVAVLNYFNVLKALNIIVTALGASFVLRFVPGA